MSLILRAKCQPLLDDVGLQNYHVAVDTGMQRTMKIVGECGQPFVSITGIQFARSTPSAAELPVALELLEAFLMKHKPEFDAYQAEMDIFAKFPAFREDTKNYSVYTEGHGTNEVWVNKYTASNFQITITELGAIYDMDFFKGYYDKVPYQKLIDMRYNQKELDAAFDYIAYFLTRRTAKKKVDTLKSIISACEI